MANTIKEASVRIQDEGGFFGWEDLRAPATAATAGGSPPPFDTSLGGYAFPGNATRNLFFILQMPHSYKIGSLVKPHIHWIPDNTDTGNVFWRMEYKWTNINEQEAAAFAQLDALVAGAGIIRQHQMSSFADIAGTGKGISSIFTVQISRIGGDALDTFSGNAVLKEFDLHYMLNSFGSIQATTKV